MSGINAMDNTVIACVDGSSSTRAVCEYAAWIAGKLDVPLALLHGNPEGDTSRSKPQKYRDT